MRSIGWLVLLCFLLGCRQHHVANGLQNADSSLTIAILGDMPYIKSAEDFNVIYPRYRKVLNEIDSAEATFIVHVGDISAQGQCQDSVIDRRYNEFMKMKSPFIYLFGDNDWTDCDVPLERLTALRERFADTDSSMGQRKIKLTRQEGYPENVTWETTEITFVGLHVVGSNNNYTDPVEFKSRNEATIQWLQAAFQNAMRVKRKGIVVFMQANPDPQGRLYFDAQNSSGFKPLLDELEKLVPGFNGRVALVHGDTHYFRVDMPLKSKGRVVPNFIRAETFGDPNMHWVLLTVDTKARNMFSFQPMVIPGN